MKKPILVRNVSRQGLAVAAAIFAALSTAMGRHSGVGRPKSKTANTDPSEAAKSALKPYQAGID